MSQLPSQNVVVYRQSPQFSYLGGPGQVHGGLVRLTGVQVAAADDGYSVTFAGVPERATYLVSAEEALLKPTIQAGRVRADITSAQVRYLVISHPDFTERIGPLVRARRAEGLSTLVVEVRDIYDRFGGGILDAQAIRDYVRYATTRMGVEYVLLVGGDTYDYRGYRYPEAISFIPSLYAATGPIVQFAPVDPLYADVNGDGVPDVAIGRLPVRTSAELASVVNKILAYQGKNYQRTAVFAADRYDARASFERASDAMVAQLPPDWEVSLAYIDDAGVDSARAALLRAMNEGRALVSYFGHSDSTRWSFENLFTAADAQALQNAQRPTVVTQWGCWNTYYVSPQQESLSHALLLSGEHGAAAVLGATTLTEAFSDEELGKRFMPRLVQPGARIGSALLAAKADLAASYPHMRDVLLGWTLLGDPAARVVP